MAERLTPASGRPVADDQNSITAGSRGPPLMQDANWRGNHKERESIMAIRWSGEISRRYLLSNAACTAGAAALLGTTMTAQAAKLPQKAASYQNSPNGAQRCGNCANFQAPSACKSVEGPIAAQGWCALYLPKKA
jgi:hypothetical protein